MRPVLNAAFTLHNFNVSVFDYLISTFVFFHDLTQIVISKIFPRIEHDESIQFSD